MAKFVLLFTLVPLIELYLLLYLGRVLGFWTTVGIVLATGLLGAALAKSQGRRVIASWQEALAGGSMPAEGVLGGVLVLIGGVLLVTPGVFTDLVGLSLLVPVTRAFWAKHLRAWLEKRVQSGDVQVMSMSSFSMSGFDATSPRAQRGDRRGAGAVIDVEGYEVPVEPTPAATAGSLLVQAEPGPEDDVK
ncbi:MAG: FxsA family protein [Sandaracinaceae bacterium]|nr:FxsA family protein [Sandaracinaceae bacterium]